MVKTSQQAEKTKTEYLIMRLTATPIFLSTMRTGVPELTLPEIEPDTLLKPCDHRGRDIALQDFELNIFIVE